MLSLFHMTLETLNKKGFLFPALLKSLSAIVIALTKYH